VLLINANLITASDPEARDSRLASRACHTSRAKRHITCSQGRHHDRSDHTIQHAPVENCTPSNVAQRIAMTPQTITITAGVFGWPVDGRECQLWLYETSHAEMQKTLADPTTVRL
jgi:hypothetical protein